MNYKIKLLLFAIVWVNCSLFPYELSSEIRPIGWLDYQEVHISEKTFYIHTNLGLVELKVLDYDDEGNRYLVECIKYGDCYFPTPEDSSN